MSARLGAAEREATLDSICAAQHRSGLVAWSPGGVADPWNHLEAAMALASGGRLEACDRALDWTAANQAADGSLPAELTSEGRPAGARVDTNAVAYVAVAVAHRHLVTGDAAASEELWPVVSRALGFVLGCRLAGGEVAWERDAAGRVGGYGLVAASSSVYQALRAGAALSGALGLEPPLGSAAALEQRDVLRAHLDGTRPGRYAGKDEYAMDWYYPVLAGVLEGDAAAARLEAGRERFVAGALGVRCRADRQWVTTAETAECALAHGACGDTAAAAALLAATRAHRLADGSYLTGLVHPGRNAFPPSERTTYSAAAVLLADDALAGGAAAGTFGWPGAPLSLGGAPLAEPAAAAPAGSRAPRR